MSVSYTFRGVVQRQNVAVTCPKCGKTRRLVVSKTYYRNGLHNEHETRKRNADWIEAKCERLQRDGVICSACKAAERGDPITKKIATDLYEVYVRSSPDTAVGQIKKRRYGLKWVLVGHEDTYQYNNGPIQRYPVGFDTLAEAAIELVQRALKEEGL